jgi:hypothetical protein
MKHVPLRGRSRLLMALERITFDNCAARAQNA